jgi:hypothetical protein
MPPSKGRLNRIHLSRDGNIVKQLLTPNTTIERVAVRYTRGRIQGAVLQPADNPQDEILIVNKKIYVPVSFSRSIESPIEPNANAAELNCSEGAWLKHSDQHEITAFGQLDGIAKRALDSWTKHFYYVKEDPPNEVLGLRNPQIGALHTILGHGSVSDEVGTIVHAHGHGRNGDHVVALARCPVSKGSSRPHFLGECVGPEKFR